VPKSNEFCIEYFNSEVDVVPRDSLRFRRYRALTYFEIPKERLSRFDRFVLDQPLYQKMKLLDSYRKSLEFHSFDVSGYWISKELIQYLIDENKY
jgi:hypothetical protein